MHFYTFSLLKSLRLLSLDTVPQYFEDSDDDEVLDVASADEIDHESVDEREENINSSGESADEEEEALNVYMSRDNKLQWYSTPPAARIRPRRETILCVLPGATTYANSCVTDNPVSAFRLFITQDIMRIITC